MRCRNAMPDAAGWPVIDRGFGAHIATGRQCGRAASDDYYQQAAGIAVRFLTPDDYYVVRADVLEDDVRLYRVVNGKRQEIKGAKTKVSANQWHTLGIRAEADRFVVSLT